MDMTGHSPSDFPPSQEYVRRYPPTPVSPTDSIPTTGILHFTISVRDHVSAATFYSELLGCRHLRSNSQYAFMECHGTYFVLAKMPNHVNPNDPDDEAHHHAFLVKKEDFDRAIDIIRARNIRLVKYNDKGHRSFPGRHAYIHDADGNGIEICALYEEGEEE
jgi:catechol-2,3-dioxygenase